MSVRTRSAYTVLAAGVVALVPSAALADPPAGDDRTPSCSALLEGVQDWPGQGPGDQTLFSDAYERHLLALPACAGAEG
ncbi:hypothetical protein GCM10027261_10580 [Geodermatophilus arenarius]|uniref:Secreted protein n=1 Tax=Geodermatophilus arenarius TaxID=1137990 RepID=A0ABV9LG63_9ACTN